MPEELRTLSGKGGAEDFANEPELVRECGVVRGRARSRSLSLS